MKRLRGSLTVEAALIYPFVLVSLIAFLQLGVVLGMRLYAELKAEETIEYYGTLREREELEEAEQQAKQYLQESLAGLPLEAVEIELGAEDYLIEETVSVRVEASYRFLLSGNIRVEKKGSLCRPMKLRNTLTMIQETGEKIPFVSKIWDQYEEMIEKWAETIRG